MKIVVPNKKKKKKNNNYTRYGDVYSPMKADNAAKNRVDRRQTDLTTSVKRQPDKLQQK